MHFLVPTSIIRNIQIDRMATHKYHMDLRVR